MIHQTPPAPRRALPGRHVWLWPLLLVAIAAAIWALPWRDWVEPMRIWVEGHGAVGWLAFLALYVLVVALPLPAAVMSVAGGLAFGWWGVPLALAGSVLGALGPFWATRRWLRGPVMRRIGTPRVVAADTVVRKHAFLFVTLLRITPLLPFTVQNYLLGLTSVRLWPYLWATLAGLAPSTVALVWLGTIGGLEAAGADHGRLVLSIGGLVGFAVLIAWMTREATRLLRRAGFDRTG